MGDEHQAAEQFYFIACISDYAICCGEDRRTLGGLYIDAFIALSADAWAEGRQYGAFERPGKFARKHSRFADGCGGGQGRSEEHTSELQSLIRLSYAAFCLKIKNYKPHKQTLPTSHNQSH